MELKKELSRYFSRLAKRGAKKAAAARMEKLTPEQRSAIARNAAKARWAKAKEK